MDTYLSHFKHTSVPLKPVIHIYLAHQYNIDRPMCGGMGGTRTDSILCILCRIKHNCPTSLGTSIDADVDVRADDGTRMAEEVFDVLPASLVG